VLVGTIYKSMRKPPQKSLDQNKIQAQKEAREIVLDLLESGDEDAFVSAVKRWKPDLTPEELRQFISLFRDAMRERRGLL
jgi:hypothetical protein